MRNFTEEQQMFRQAYRRFLEEEIVPHREEWHEQGIVDREAFRRAGDKGFLMIWPDPEYGGMGDSDFRFEQIIIEENYRVVTSDWYCTLHSRLVGPYLAKHGTAAQKARYLPRCVSGETILAIAMTEPGAGSDLSAIRTTAIDQGDHYLLNGSKIYISNGINADVVIVAARTEAGEGRAKLSLLLVERGMPGFERGRKLRKIGMNAQDTAELFFNDVKVPKENLLGEEGRGLSYLIEALAEERLIAAVKATSASWKALELTRDFVLDRQMFGKRLADMQNTQFVLAGLSAEIEAMQIYIDHCVSEHNEGRLTAEMGAKAKLLSTELQFRVCDAGLQLHGGAGYMDEQLISRLFTTARANRIAGGASEVMKLIIGRDLLSQNYRSFFE